MVLLTTPCANQELKVRFRLQKVPDLLWILCRCLKLERCEHGEPRGCLKSPGTLVLGAPGAQGCATASVGGVVMAGLGATGNTRLPVALLQPLGHALGAGHAVGRSGETWGCLLLIAALMLCWSGAGGQFQG